MLLNLRIGVARPWSRRSSSFCFRRSAGLIGATGRHTHTHTYTSWHTNQPTSYIHTYHIQTHIMDHGCIVVDGRGQNIRQYTRANVRSGGGFGAVRNHSQECPVCRFARLHVGMKEGCEWVVFVFMRTCAYVCADHERWPSEVFGFRMGGDKIVRDD